MEKKLIDTPGQWAEMQTEYPKQWCLLESITIAKLFQKIDPPTQFPAVFVWAITFDSYEGTDVLSEWVYLTDF